MTDSRVEINPELSLTELVDRAASSKVITLTDHGQEKAVLLSIEAFEQLVSIQAYRQRELMSIEELRSHTQQVFGEAGYHTHSDIINLVQDVKQEIVTERFQTASPPQNS